MTKRRRVRVFGVAAVLAVLGVWAVRRADAIIIINSKPAVDTVFGLGAFDVARVYIANISSGIQPCTVEACFFGPRGELLHAVAQKVMPGETAFVDYSDPTLGLPTRKPIRARVLQDVPPPDDRQPAPACMTMTEVFDGRTGQGLFIIDDGDRAR